MRENTDRNKHNNTICRIFMRYYKWTRPNLIISSHILIYTQILSLLVLYICVFVCPGHNESAAAC